ncbi:MAG: ATP-grasp domain-containing protein [Pseudonocardiaceae bacterium]|nr:ATP-grasp domain-containing protein [Pseudonocardiaceae bacterium]
MLSKVLVANRGEIAVRILRSCQELGIATVAVHPGYGFLAENADFARRCEQAGVVFVGPAAETLAELGDKVRARALAARADVAMVPGTESPTGSVGELLHFGARHGWPVAVKAVHGGGGRGLRVVDDPSTAAAALDAARDEAASVFGDPAVYLERYLDAPRHIEVQLFADRHGSAVWLGDRDCSVQRRHRKVVEEAPAPGLRPALRREMGDTALRLARAAGYVGAGTVEFLVSGGEFCFLEVNPRIQVEHPVTEQVLGIDLVREQLLVAGGAPLSWSESGPEPRGHAVQCRLSAEDPRSLLPNPGPIDELAVPWRVGLRFDGGYEAGDDVPPQYDSLIGKLIAWAPTRDVALRRLADAVGALTIRGVDTTASLLRAVLAHPDVIAGGVSTRWLEDALHELVPAVEAPTTVDGQIGGGEGWIGGRRYVVPRPAAPPNGSPGARRGARPTATTRAGNVGHAAGAGVVTSPVPGTVVAIEVEPGAAVAAGSVLVTVEAMKMENPLRAPCAGTVDSVGVSAGDAVTAGAPLVVVRPS